MKRHPLLLRGAAIAAVALSILVPIALIEGKISERRNRAEGVLQQFAAETSGPQVVAGPFLALACEETYTSEREIMRSGKAETIAEQKVRPCPTGYVSPRSLDVSGQVPVEARHRGIYPIKLYRARLRLAGEIVWPGPPRQEAQRSRVWRQAHFVLFVRDSRGIRELRSSPGEKPAAANTKDPRFAYHSDLGEYAAEKAGERLPFEVALELVGTSSLGIAPAGDDSRITLTSDWPHPSFIGAWSPDERRITAQGFEATWRTTHHATGGQAAWEKAARADPPFQGPTTAGVALFDPVNVYTLSYRATEYGFLFVLFTFAALALAEALAGVRLHAVQYLLVGSAIAVFFLLLLALSEHIDFAAAYASAAAACIALLTFYLRHPLGTARRSAAFLGFFSAMYASLYVLLRSEDHALLMGSLLVFGLLAAAMVATRRIDWSSLSTRLATQP
jgi:inner membrane protein